jgi:TrmH family RNA methyltransferase
LLERRHVITSADNEKLKLVRKLNSRSGREKAGLFVAEGEDLVAAAREAGVDAEFVLVADDLPDLGAFVAHSDTKAPITVEARLLDALSALGSGTRVLGVYPMRFSQPGGRLSVYLHAVGDPGNVGTITRSAHALADGPVILGPDCADPYSPKAVRASMGSIFTRPPARANLTDLSPTTVIALDATAQAALADVPAEPPVVVCIGAEREGLPPAVLEGSDATARIPIRDGGPDSLNAAMAATVALYELGQATNRIGRHG